MANHLPLGSGNDPSGYASMSFPDLDEAHRPNPGPEAVAGAGQQPSGAGLPAGGPPGPQAQPQSSSAAWHGPTAQPQAPQRQDGVPQQQGQGQKLQPKAPAYHQIGIRPGFDGRVRGPSLLRVRMRSCRLSWLVHRVMRHSQLRKGCQACLQVSRTVRLPLRWAKSARLARQDCLSATDLLRHALASGQVVAARLACKQAHTILLCRNRRRQEAHPKSRGAPTSHGRAQALSAAFISLEVG